MNLPSASVSKKITETIESVLNGVERPIYLHEPSFDTSEINFVVETIKSTVVSSAGSYVAKFEDEIKSYTSAKYVIAVINGTAALETALRVAGIKRGDEVLVPTLSFIATANAVAHVGAIPHFIDSEEDSLGIDPHKLESYLGTMTYDISSKNVINPKTSNRIKAIIPMHTIGHPNQIEKIIEISERFGLTVIEDAAESLGSLKLKHDGTAKHTGTFGKLGVISFNGNKIVTTGGGGAILTDDEKFAEVARKLTNTAKIPHDWEFEHEMVSWNYRLPNINAALGVAQFSKLDNLVQKKRTLAQKYIDAFKEIEEVEFISEPVLTRSNYWLSSIKLKNPTLELRNEILQYCKDKQIFARPLWNLLSSQRMYLNNPAGNLDQAKLLQKAVICLPSSPKLIK